MHYNKPPLTYDEQIDRLVERGLAVNDRQFARDVLARIGYCRLSAYRFPFQKDIDLFKTGATFDDLYAVYVFDQKLRQIVLSIIS